MLTLRIERALELLKRGVTPEQHTVTSMDKNSGIQTIAVNALFSPYTLPALGAHLMSVTELHLLA
eukprot:1782478-Amphidinium_carterae.1